MKITNAQLASVRDFLIGAALTLFATLIAYAGLAYAASDLLCSGIAALYGIYLVAFILLYRPRPKAAYGIGVMALLLPILSVGFVVALLVWGCVANGPGGCM